MRRLQLIMGGAILILGLLLLIGNLTGIDVCAYLFPIILIGAGIWLVTRPAFSKGRDMEIQILGDIQRRGRWAVRDQDLVCGVGDIRLDFTEAVVPAGETTLKLRGFINSILVIVPETMGVSITSGSFLTTATVFGYKQDYFFTVYHTESDRYAGAAHRVHLELAYVIADLKVRAAKPRHEDVLEDSPETR